MSTYVSDKGSPIFPQLLTDWPLYRQTKIEDAHKFLSDFLFSNFDFYVHCRECEKESHFKSVDPPSAARLVLDARSHTKMEFDIADGVHTRQFKCSRTSKHKITVILESSGNKVRKIGQSSSTSELRAIDKKRYARELGSEEKAEEFSNAIVLHGFGMSIGAFVYARRVFEFLVDTAESQAKAAGKTFTYENQYPPVHEKINNLKDYLPNFMVSHAHIYPFSAKASTN